jgi:hypothetical protein
LIFKTVSDPISAPQKRGEPQTLRERCNYWAGRRDTSSKVSITSGPPQGNSFSFPSTLLFPARGLIISSLSIWFSMKSLHEANASKQNRAVVLQQRRPIYTANGEA